MGFFPRESDVLPASERLTGIENKGHSFAQARRSEICDESLRGAVGRTPTGARSMSAMRISLASWSHDSKNEVAMMDERGG